jgi:hypothetical protein
MKNNNSESESYKKVKKKTKNTTIQSALKKNDSLIVIYLFGLVANN